MKLFNEDGMMIIPSPMKNETADKKKVLVVKECYCPSGHNLVSNRANFNGHAGVILKLKNEEKQGLVALSPIYGDKSRISLDLDLVNDEIYKIHCPECNAEHPTYTKCSCGADLVALFSTKEADFSNCIGICNRVGCTNAEIIQGSELLSHSNIENM